MDWDANVTVGGVVLLLVIIALIMIILGWRPWNRP